MRLSRRRFLQVAGLAAAAACTEKTRPSAVPSASPSVSPPAPAPPSVAPVRWSRIDATGPKARRDHTLTAVAGGSLLVLVGGRAKGKPLGDTWIFDRSKTRWEQIRGDSPSPRFGHSVFVGQDVLHLFGGQGEGSDFFDDLWIFDPVTKRWKASNESGPSKRYGAGACGFDETKGLVSHGFTFEGRFDDTWVLNNQLHETTWKDVTPKGRKPVERCLHRMAFPRTWSNAVLFGGQTNATPFLGDTWLFNPETGRWNDVTPIRSPSARRLPAMIATAKSCYLSAGATAGGLAADTWRFDGRTWTKLSPAGDPPPAREASEGAGTGSTMIVFGGAGEEGELDDMWELSGLT